MQLEQLVGSNSFGSAIKQPMVLRQLDALSLLLLLTWCLSPFGSQALQRTYRTGFAQKNDKVEVYYLNQTGSNKVFASNWNTTTSAPAHAADNQMTAILFLSTLVPTDESLTSHIDSYFMDAYKHPILVKPQDPNREKYDVDPIAGSGLPIVLPDTELPQDSSFSGDLDTASLYEYINFDATASYFEFTCDNWSTINYTKLLSLNHSEPMSWSSSYTLGMKFTNKAGGNTSNIDHLLFVSANLGTNTTDDIITDRSLWDYSLIQCDFQQHFINASIYCERWPSSTNGLNLAPTDLSCYSDESNVTSPNIVANQKMGTDLEDFSDDWTSMAAPRNPDKKGVSNTPSELSTTNHESLASAMK